MNYLAMFEVISPSGQRAEFWMMFRTLEALREYESRSTLHTLRHVYQLIELHDVTSEYRKQ